MNKYCLYLSHEKSYVPMLLHLPVNSGAGGDFKPDLLVATPACASTVTVDISLKVTVASAWDGTVRLCNSTCLFKLSLLARLHLMI
jgi:hypothetical protein